MPNYFSENPERYDQRSLYDPQQQAVRQQLMQMGMQGIQQGPPNIKQLLEASDRNFQENTVPQFGSLYGGGLKGGGGFQARLAELGKNYNTQQAGLEYNAQAQNYDRYKSLLDQALKPSFREDFVPRDPSIAERIGIPAAQGGIEYGLQKLLDKAFSSKEKKKIGQFEDQTGDENKDENWWWEKLKSIFPWLATTAVGAATGGVGGAAAAAIPSAIGYALGGGSKQKPSFGAADLYKAGGQMQNYLPNPATRQF